MLTIREGTEQHWKISKTIPTAATFRVWHQIQNSNSTTSNSNKRQINNDKPTQSTTKFNSWTKLKPLIPPIYHTNKIQNSNQWHTSSPALKYTYTNFQPLKPLIQQRIRSNSSKLLTNHNSLTASWCGDGWN